ncbi:MAG: diguanylate cyclase [Spirochaetales bacterium]|nr:diguanylate cyclase [Spirochaetales bacterium]
MKQQRPAVITLELLAVLMIMGIANFLLATNDPGYFSLPFNPYFILALFATVLYGKYYGFFSLIVAIVFIVIPIPVYKYFYESYHITLSYWMKLGQKMVTPFTLTLVGVFIFGLIRDSLKTELDKTKYILGSITKEKNILQREVDALKQVNRELEKRVYSQEDSTIMLYSKIQELYSLNFQKGLELLLTIAQTYTGATVCSIWEHNQELRRLELRLNYGWDMDMERITRIAVEDSIEGWVLRNNMMFSVRMVMQYDNLARMDKGRNILTVPVTVGHKVWGVFNIEDIPFEKYNLYTEKYLLMIMALVSPALEKAMEYEAFSIQENVNLVTGFPPFSHFYIILEQELSRVKLEKGTLSVMIVELVNYEKLLHELSKDGVYSLFVIISERIKELSDSKAMFFHYKNDNQISFILPNLDYDGCSLFCLNILEMINKRTWELNKKTVLPEIIMGYTSLTEDKQSAEDLLAIAENLLEMQKI